MLGKKRERGWELSSIFFIGYLIFIMRGNYVDEEVYVSFLMMLAWLCVALFSDSRAFLKSLFTMPVIFVMYHVTLKFIVSCLENGLKVALGALLGEVSLFVGIVMYHFYRNHGNPKMINNLVIGTLAVWLYFCAKACAFYWENPGAARILISTGRNEYGNIAIGQPYALAYGSCLIAVYMLGYVIMKNNLLFRYKILILAGFAALSYVVFATQSTITTLSLIMGVLFCAWLKICYTGNRKKKTLALLLSLIFLGAAVVCFLSNAKDIGLWLVNAFSQGEGVYATRMEDIGKAIYHWRAEGGLASRWTLYKQSFTAFIESPFYGFGNLVNTVGINGAGNHSELLDSLCQYGMIGWPAYIGIFILCIVHERKNYSKNVLGGYVLSLILMMTFNPFRSAQSNLALFFVLPILGQMTTHIERRRPCR